VLHVLAVFFSILAGAAMSLQGVFDTRLSDRIGLYESNVLVQGVAFFLSVIALLFLGSGDIMKLNGINKLYLLGGFLGIIITISVMLAMKGLGPTIAVSIILISQLLVAALIDAFGIFDTERIPFCWQKYAGVALMVGGVLLFKWKN
jgi:transporter family-2 protein